MQKDCAQNEAGEADQPAYKARKEIGVCQEKLVVFQAGNFRGNVCEEATEQRTDFKKEKDGITLRLNIMKREGMKGY